MAALALATALAFSLGTLIVDLANAFAFALLPAFTATAALAFEAVLALTAALGTAVFACLCCGRNGGRHAGFARHGISRALTPG